MLIQKKKMKKELSVQLFNVDPVSRTLNKKALKND